jgi:hypothetical protein
MKTALVLVLLIPAIGGFAAIFDASDGTERAFDAICSLIGICGLAVMAYLRRRRIGAEQFNREMGFKSEPLPSGTPSALAMASQDPPKRITPGAGAIDASGSMPLVLMLDAARSLLNHAQQLSKSSDTTQLQLAVIFAQSACELHTEKALSELMRQLSTTVKGAILELCGETISLADTRARQLWRALTNDHVSDQSWWKAWKDNRDLRNDVAHEGRSVSAAEAVRSVELAEYYIEHLTRTVAATHPKP